MWYRDRLKFAAFDGFGGYESAEEMAKAIKEHREEPKPKFEGTPEEQHDSMLDNEYNVRQPLLISKLESILNSKNNFMEPVQIRLNAPYQQYTMSYDTEDHIIYISPIALYQPQNHLISLLEHEISHAKEYDYARKFKKPQRQLSPDQKDWDRQMRNYQELDTLKTRGVNKGADDYDDYDDGNNDYNYNKENELIDYYNHPSEVIAYASSIRNEINSLSENKRQAIIASSSNYNSFVEALNTYSVTFKNISPYLIRESLKQMVLIIYNSLMNPRR